MYDPATNTWIQKGDMPQGIYTGCFTGVVDGKIYVVGGDGRGNRVDEYDPESNTWTRKANMQIFTTDQATCVLEDKIYVIGGESGPAPTYPGKTNVSVYDPIADSWTTAPDMPTRRFGLRASATGGKIYVIGGMDHWGATALRTVEEYDPEAGTSVYMAGSPKSFRLSQNYPNPFNPTTTIRFDLPKSSFVTLKIFDILGREIITLVNEKRPTGEYAVEWNENGFPNGIYLYRLKAGDYIETRKLVLQK
jgi:hypothetical protein